jgi:predicted acylesterase/phospholipase RssA
MNLLDRSSILASDTSLRDETVGGDSVASKPEDSITLLLSGGGFRATLFHLGVIACLRDNQQLHKVKEIFSISGGSILAGHLAEHWNDYAGGKDDQFDRAASKLVAFVRKGVRETIIGWFLLQLGFCWLVFSLSATAAWWYLQEMQGAGSPWVWLLALLPAVTVFLLLDRWLRPIKVLEGSYARFYSKFSLSMADKSAPEFYILSTNLTTGNPTCFTRQGVMLDIADFQATPKLLEVDCALATAVAASSAFPPLFSPVVFDPKRYQLDQQVLSHPHYLTDGGVFDNLGIACAQRLSRSQGRILVSDAERRFDWETAQSFRAILPRASRSTDILMNRVGGLSYAGARACIRGTGAEAPCRDVAFIRLQDDRKYGTEPFYNRWKHIYSAARQLRTDLDAFTALEIQCLYGAGYLAAQEQLTGTARFPSDVQSVPNGIPLRGSQGGWMPIAAPDQFGRKSPADQLALGRTSALKIFQWTRWTFWLGVLIFLGGLLLNPLALDMVLHVPHSVQQLKIEVKALSDATREDYFTAIEPHELEVEPLGEFSKEHRLIISSHVVHERDYLNRSRPFTFSIECNVEHAIIYRRAIVRSLQDGSLRYCGTDVDGKLLCPACDGSSDLIIYAVVATHAGSTALSSKQVQLNIH